MTKNTHPFILVVILISLMASAALAENYPTFRADEKVEGLYYWNGNTEPEEDFISEDESEKIKTLVLPSEMRRYNGIYNVQIEALEEYTVDEASEYLTSADGVLFTKDMSILLAYPRNKRDTEYTIPDGVIRIGDYAFAGNSNIQSVYFSSDIKWVGNSAFEGCLALRNVRFNNDLCCIENDAFMNCSSLVTITCPDGLRVIGSRAFYMSSLAEITLNEGLNCIMGEAFFTQCFGTKTINIPKSVLYMDRTVFAPNEAITLQIHRQSAYMDLPLDGIAAVAEIP